MNLLALSFPLITGLALAISAWMCRRAESLQLIQVPTSRSSHKIPTPSGGGLGIVVAASLGGAGLVLFFGWTLGGLVLGLGLLLAVMGLRDDVRHLSAYVRLSVQLPVCAGFLIALGDLPSISFSDDLKLEHAWVLMGVLLLAGVWWINLFNFMDGIDGIAGAQAIFMLLGGAALSAWVSAEVMSNPIWMLMQYIAAATGGFLLLNWPPSKIFMGDVGSTWLAFMLFALALLSVQAGWLSYITWLVLSALFVTDATTTLLTRILRRERWYEAHCCHAYQRLTRRWIDNRKSSHGAVTLLAIGINLLWIWPLSAATIWLPAGNWFWLSLAYLPLSVGVLWTGKTNSLKNT